MSVSSEIDACRQQLRACERAFRWWLDDKGDYHEDEAFDQEKQYLGHRLKQAHLRMLLLIEAIGLPLFRETYVEGFSEFKDELHHVRHWEEDRDIISSSPLTYIDQAYEALHATLKGDDIYSINQLDLFERTLRQTPYIIADRKITPSSEKDVRQALFDVLKVIFPDCRREIPVSHIFKKYRADLGSGAIKALAEVKYALDETELRSELDGIYADMRGYNGDPQWTRFYALIYTAQPIAAPERILEEFKLSRADMSWTPIIVHGPGTRARRNEKSRAAAKPSIARENTAPTGEKSRNR